ncbi:PQQ-binding-like beta-propeller repeat protein [Halobacteriaceae archaeon GCM10025711]
MLAFAGSAALAGCAQFRGSSGTRRWTAQFGEDYIDTTPYIGDDYVAVAVPNGNLAVLDIGDGSLRHSVRRPERWHVAGTPPVPVGEAVVTVTDEVLAVARSGEEIWNEPFPDDEYAMLQSRPIVVNESLYVTTDTHWVLEIDLDERTFQRASHDPVAGRWWDSDGDVAVVGTSTLRTMLVDLTTGETLWEHSAGLVAHPCLVESDVVTPLSTSDGLELARFDPAADTERWRIDLLGGQSTFTAQLSDDVLAVVTRTQSTIDAPARVTLVTAETGDVAGTYEIPGGVIPSGAIHDGRLFLTTPNGQLRSITTDGVMTTHYEFDGAITSPPAIRDGLAVFGTDNGEVRAVEID